MPEIERLLKVFLCHVSQDKPVVRELYQHLIAEGWIDTWLDEKKLLPGQDWRLNIEEAVETSDIVIVCLSSNSVSKEGFVQKELRYAREISLEKPEGSIFLIPLRLDDCDVPRGLRFFQWADYFGKKESETYKDLIKSLKLRHEQVLQKEEHARKYKQIEKRELDTTINASLALSNLHQFSASNFPAGRFVEELLETEGEIENFKKLLNLCFDNIISEQFEDGDAKGAWAKRYAGYLKFIYQDLELPIDFSTHESISISQIITTNLLNYAKTFNKDNLLDSLLPRLELLRNYLLKHHNHKIGGFGISSRPKLRGPMNIDVDLRHTLQALQILWTLGLDSETEDVFRKTGDYLKRELDSLDYKQERILSLGAIHHFLTSNASGALILSEASRRSLQKRIESVVVERYDKIHCSWDMDLEPVRTTRIDNALFLLGDMPVQLCLDSDCKEVLSSATKRLLETTSIKVDSQCLAIPFLDKGNPDIGATIQLARIAIKNPSLNDTHRDQIKAMLSFCINDEYRQRFSEFSYPWHLSSIFEIASTS